MSDLVEFLRARYDEDEQRTQRGYYSDTHWRLFTTTAHLKAWVAWRGHYPREQWDVKANDVIADAARDGIRERIDAHEADRTACTLREIEAKRQFLDFAVRTRDLADQQPTDGQARELRAKWAAYLTALKFDALPYADHEDFQEEWRP